MSNDYIRDVLGILIAQQNVVLNKFSLEKRVEGSGRAASLLIDWPDGIRTYDLWFTSEQGVQWKPPDIKVRNEIYLTEDTFYLIAIGVKDLKEAKDHGEVLISGEHSLYDSLEFKGIWDEVKEKILRPMIEGNMLTKSRREG